MAPYDRKQPVDPNIIEALKSLPAQMINHLGVTVTIREKAGRETGYEHIADTGHGLQVRDILRIPGILRKPDAVCVDLIHPRDNKVYDGCKYRKNRFDGFIKIVTSKGKSGGEVIVTVFLTKRIKEKHKSVFQRKRNVLK